MIGSIVKQASTTQTAITHSHMYTHIYVYVLEKYLKRFSSSCADIKYTSNYLLKVPSTRIKKTLVFFLVIQVNTKQPI